MGACEDPRRTRSARRQDPTEPSDLDSGRNALRALLEDLEDGLDQRMFSCSYMRRTMSVRHGPTRVTRVESHLVIALWPHAQEGWRYSVDTWHRGLYYGRDQAVSVEIMIVVAPIVIGVVYAFLMSMLREPARRRLNAIMVAGAGAAYLSSGGGFGPWEFVFTAAVTYCAYRGLDSYVWIGVAWLLHAAWDILHYLRGAPIIPFASHSSFGCAICDPVIAIWCLRGGPSLPGLIKSWFSPRPASASDAPGARARRQRERADQERPA